MTIVAALVQVLGGLALAPLLPGTVQSLKARLQGRRGPSPLQPYRHLRRLWGKSGADPQPSTIVYRLAPCVVAAATALALLLIPIAGRAPDWSLGNDALVLVGLLALGRFALAAASWDTGSGFALMGSSRDLTFAVFAEPLLLLALIVAALPAGGTDLVAMSAAAGGSAPWGEPAHWCGAAAFALVVLVETGRQPIDNPDTHLELTMIHEGPLLEYAGRDLALLEWGAAARHWIVLVLAAELFGPHWGGFWAQLGWLVLGVAVLCAALAVTETAQAKMRILRAPGLLAGGCALALVGLASALVGGLV
ncbi:MAG: NADH-quinone oxidoreductase subunit H [Actinobacteria bacterium]|nr:NADH-quinone oxidoreductase subunit H [Actinomycetota bacterium]